MKTFKQFINEAAFALPALKGASMLPKILTGIGAMGTANNVFKSIKDGEAGRLLRDIGRTLRPDSIDKDDVEQQRIRDAENDPDLKKLDGLERLKNRMNDGKIKDRKIEPK